MEMFVLQANRLDSDLNHIFTQIFNNEGEKLMNKTEKSNNLIVFECRQC